MMIHSNDESTNNVDAENAPATSGTNRESDDLQITAQESARVDQWHKEIAVSRAFDEEVRKLYAMDRRYARADTSAAVQHSLIQAYIDILVAFLVARDPDFDCPPAERVGDTELKNAELYGKTMSIVVRHLLKSARLKRVAAKVVRSALSVGIGWLKAVWHEEFITDPKVSKQLKDVQANIALLEATRKQIENGDYGNYDAKMQEYADIENGLAAKLEVVAAQGMSLAMINPEDMVSSIETECVIDVEEASWMGHRYFLLCDAAAAAFPRIPVAMLKSATKYTPRKPIDRKSRDQPGAVLTFNSEDADSFVTGGNAGNTAQFLSVYEIWNGEANQFFTLVEGIKDRYAREPSDPQAPTTRFYPFFALTFTEIDGERHPQSLIQRSYKMQDEIDRALNGLVEHRKRNKPGMLFDSAAVDSATVKRVASGATGEYMGVKMKGDPGKRDIRRAFMTKQYNQVDMGLYDIAPYIRCMETTWGIQEALTGTVQVAKTATEAEIQQAGTEAKSGHKRDILEGLLADLGIYTSEIAAWKLKVEDVRLIAGSEAYWIPIDDVEEMKSMISIEVRAGSSGKPDTAGRRDAWMALSQKMQELIMAISDMRQSPPDQTADCLEAVMTEMAARLGERIDVKQFIPQGPENPVMNPMNPSVPLTGTQAQELQIAQANAMAAMGGAAPGAGAAMGGPAPGGPPVDGAAPPGADGGMPPEAMPPKGMPSPAPPIM